MPTRRPIHVPTAIALLGCFAPAAPAQGWSQTRTIGQTPSGAPIRVTAIGAPGEDALGRTLDQRPALLVIAGAQAHHRIGTTVAERLAARLLDGRDETLESHTVYVLSDLTPGADPLGATPAFESPRVPQPADADRDRRTDEDGADDLNADGLITMMRVAHPSPGSGLAAEWVIDDVEPRLMRKPKPEDGEVATHALLIEGVDNDADGAFNEDGPGGAGGGGVNLDRNFPSHYDEHADGAGLYATSRPETRALIDWLLTRDNIVAAVVYGPHDNLVKAPETGKFDQTGRMPKGLEKNDEAMHKAIAKVFTDITGMKEAPRGDTDGSLVSYLYSDFGVWAFSTPVWVRPDQVKGDDDPEENGNDADGDDAQESPDEAAMLRDRGVPEELISFLTATEEERATIIAEFESLPQEEQAARMQAIGELPADVRNRIMSIAQGQGDPGMAAPEDDQPAAEAGADDKKGDAKSKADKDELAWLAYSDEHRDGSGFVDWVEVDHPQLGAVEVGGFVPGFRVNPPEEDVDRLVDQQAEFVGALLAKLPRLEVAPPEAERLGEGLWRVRVRATNPGFLPTQSAIGVKARRLAPVVVSIELDPDDIVSGARHRQLWSIPGSGGHADCEWIVRGNAGDSITITTRSSVYADRTHTVELTEGR